MPSSSSPAPMESIPGPDGYPIVGDLVAFQRDAFAFRERLAREYGPIARYHVLGQPVILLNDPADVKTVLVEENDRFVKGEFFQERLGRVLGNGLLNSEGETWRRRRVQVQPSFRPERIEAYGEIMADRALATADRWGAGGVRDVHPDMMRVTLEIVAKALFDVDIGDRTDAVGEALDVIMRQSERFLPFVLPDDAPTPANRRFQDALSTLDGIVYDIIDERAADTGEDVVSALLEAEDGPDREGIRDEVMTLLLAGHETTALALTFALFLLAHHTHVQRRLRAELDEVLGGDPPTMADLPDLPYTERVVTEAMRLYPPVHTLIREPTEDVVLGGHRVRAGTPVTMSQWVLHRDGSHFANPHRFRPDRWTDGLAAELPDYAYFPFGGGPRRCIGEHFAKAEARIVLATLVDRFAVEPVTEPPLELGAATTTRPKEPVRVRLRPVGERSA